MKWIAIATTAALIAGGAHAETLRLQLDNVDGTTMVLELADGKIQTAEGFVFDYSFSEDRKEMCTIVPDFGNICTVFDAPIENTGDTANYETPDLGRTGTAIVLEKS
ncbi:MAG: hypothetical protein AAGF33_05065 [Pseudomonadota bacterium]